MNHVPENDIIDTHNITHSFFVVFFFPSAIDVHMTQLNYVSCTDFYHRCRRCVKMSCIIEMLTYYWKTVAKWQSSVDNTMRYAEPLWN